MSNVLVDTGTTCEGQPAIIMESPVWRVVVLPSLGGKIWSLEYRGFDFLWHNPKLKPGPVPSGASYDENWVGGWDEIFPCDAPYVHEGKPFPDHGEWWNAVWQCEIAHEQGAAVLHLSAHGHVTGAQFDKWIRIPASGSALQLAYRILNPGEALPYLFKLHPALRISNNTRIILPGCRFTPDTEFCTWFHAGGQSFRWPRGQKADGSPIDLTQVQTSASGAILFGHAAELEHGYCGILYPEQKVG